MPALIDISMRLHPAMPVWPGSSGIHVSRTMRIEDGADANVSSLEMDVHCGTHVEAPLHFLPDGAALDGLPIETFVGRAVVADLTTVDAVTARELAALQLPDGTLRLLLRTRNSVGGRANEGFRTDYVAITADAASWLAQRGIRLVGIDYLSIQRFSDDAETHRILMRAGIVILEGLDLQLARPGAYTLVCLPLKIAGVEAAPVRAVLIADGESK